MSHSPIILIHGFRGTHEGLSLITKALEPTAKCYVPDLPGFGEGPNSDTYTLNDYVEWLHGYIAKIPGTKKPVLLGHSFGSIVCAAYAMRFPETISRLVLVNPIGAPALEGPRALLSRAAVAYYWIGKTLPASIGKAWLSSRPSVQVMSSVMAKTRDKSLRKYIHQQHFEHFSRFHSADSVYQGFVTSVSHSVRDFAAHIKTPTLLIAGDRDDITPLEKQRELQTLFPNAALAVIENVGHLTHYETPGEVAQAVQAFTKSL